MSDQESAVAELIGECAAYRAALSFTLEAVRAFSLVRGTTPPDHLQRPLESRLKQLKGERLHLASHEMKKDLQAAQNQSFQQTFDELSRKIVDAFSSGQQQE